MNQKFRKGLHIIRENPKRLIALLIANRAFGWIPDDQFLKIIYYCRTGGNLNLRRPQTFNEKLQWLKINDHNPDYIKQVDKFLVREYIANTIGEEHLVPMLGIYDRFEDINFEELPNEFVLKCTHDSGGVVICRDKKSLDIKAAKKKITKSLKRNFYYPGREWPYKNIEPRIICEKYMVDESGIELKDYKFLCFNGEAKCLFVCLNRGSTKGLNVDFYDMNWSPMPFERHYSNSGTVIAKPKKFEQMVKFAERLSRDIPFVRVDFYEANGQVYFGELTFYPGSGFENFDPPSYDEKLGSWITLPEKVKGK